VNVELTALLADVQARYPVDDVFLFGSRARGDARLDSDWDVIVCLDEDAPAETVEELCGDESLRRHFETSLDLFVLLPSGQWRRLGDRGPDRDWLTYGWFPDSSAYRGQIKADAVSLLRGGVVVPEPGSRPRPCTLCGAADAQFYHPGYGPRCDDCSPSADAVSLWAAARGAP
jgi:predicted nucleotidyltransferase